MGNKIKFQRAFALMPQFWNVRNLLGVVSEIQKEDIQQLIVDKVAALNSLEPITITEKAALLAISKRRCMNDNLAEAEIVYDSEPIDYEFKKELCYFIPHEGTKKAMGQLFEGYSIGLTMQCLKEDVPPEILEQGGTFGGFKAKLGISALHAVITTGIPQQWGRLGHCAHVIFDGTILKDSKGYFTLGLSIQDWNGHMTVLVTRHNPFYNGETLYADYSIRQIEF